ncbi:hypothetical protein CC80DRAFT_498250 [Byssothecium circinans]|uniref:Uncharacterized protein n=1 Tax=Byssothecium circinans TaxID=147558 RepID=A0A6A5T828_9PLEO|nr:hypothetical protein CC80DRAFT_498250 [Byssothecium circinans]
MHSATYHLATLAPLLCNPHRSASTPIPTISQRPFLNSPASCTIHITPLRAPIYLAPGPFRSLQGRDFESPDEQAT